MYRSENPATGQAVEEFALASEPEIERALCAARCGFEEWRKHSLENRAKLLVQVAKSLEQDLDRFSRLMAEEMGKVVSEGRAEAERCAKTCRYFAAHADQLLATDNREFQDRTAAVRFEPLGTVFAIMPWNFPFWQVFRCAAPALMAGNTVLLKHAPNTPRCANAIAALFREAQPHPGVFQSLFLDNDQAARVISDPRIAGVSLTGSVRAGKQVGKTAGESLKKMVLELGGSDPFIVLADADVEKALAAAVSFRCFNSGQSCISPKRILVAKPLFDCFLGGFVAGMQARVVGDPLDPRSQNGPLARADLRDQLADQVARSKAAGAEVLLGGAPLPGAGWFYPPTVLVGVRLDSPAVKEELFGPVGVLVPFENEDEAVQIANASEFGLGAGIWTTDEARGLALAERLETGTVILNDWVRSEPALPFGGIKLSGIGKELGLEGIREFTNTKTVWAASRR